MHSFYLSAAHKSSGKTVISIALSAIFSKNFNVQTFKKGPDYIDPIWLKAASNNNCYNLDFYTMTIVEIKELYYNNLKDVNIIEGNKGLYDGITTLGGDANADLAKLLNIPIILVIDTIGISRGIAPLLLGYQSFDSNVNIAGVILNKVGGVRHETKLINAIKGYTDITVLGSVYKSSDLIIDERHLGLKPANEDLADKNFIMKSAVNITQQIDIDKILDITKQQVIKQKNIINTNTNTNITIAVARDSVFGFYYADDLDKFKQLNVSIKYFNTLVDKKLPTADGLFIGGGFPETNLTMLSDNKLLLVDIKNKIMAGMPAYAECGGMMYLTNSIDNYKMVGIIDADTIMTTKPIGRGYMQLTSTKNHLWGVKNNIAAHEFHYSKLVNLKEFNFAFKVTRGVGINNNFDGIIKHNLIATYVHQRNVGGNNWLVAFCNFVKSYKQ